MSVKMKASGNLKRSHDKAGTDSQPKLKKEAIVYTTRIDHMNVFKNKYSEMWKVKYMLQQIEVESKPLYTIKQESKQKECKQKKSNKKKSINSEISYYLMKAKLYSLRRKFPKLIPVVDLTDDADNKEEITNNSVKTIPQVDKKENIQTLKVEDQNLKKSNTIEVGAKHNYKDRAKTDIYALDEQGNVLGHFKKTFGLLNVQDMNAHTSLIFNYCCWYDRDKNVEIISNRLNSTTLRRIRIAHNCVPGQCECCCKPKSKNYVVFNVDDHFDNVDIPCREIKKDNDEVEIKHCQGVSEIRHDQGIKEIKLEQEVVEIKQEEVDLGISNERVTEELLDSPHDPFREVKTEPVDSEIQFEQDVLEIAQEETVSENVQYNSVVPALSCNTDDNVSSKIDNIILKTLLTTKKTNLLNAQYMKHDKTQSSKFSVLNEHNNLDNYETDAQGSICSLQIDQPDLMNTKILGKICCWYARQILIKKLKSQKTSESVLAFVNKKHTCPTSYCICCCRPIRISKDIFTNVLLSEHPLHTEEYPSIPQSEKCVFFQPISSELKKNPIEKNNSLLGVTTSTDIEDELFTYLIHGPSANIDTISMVEVDKESKEETLQTHNQTMPTLNQTMPAFNLAMPHTPTMPVIEKVESLNPIVQTSQTLINDLLKKFRNISLVVDDKNKVHLNFNGGHFDFSVEEMTNLNTILKYAQNEIDNMDETMRSYVVNPTKAFYKSGTDLLAIRRESFLKSFKECFQEKKSCELAEASGSKSKTSRKKRKIKVKYIPAVVESISKKRKIPISTKPKKKEQEAIVTINIDSD